VYKAIPNLSTQIPKLDQAGGSAIHLGYINRGNTPHALKIRVKGPDGTAEFSGLLEPARELIAAYPQDFQVNAKAAKQGRYVAEVSVDGAQWLADVFELALPREAQPRIINVRIPPTIQAGRPFEVRVEAQNQGAESDWGGITVSSPEPSAMKITGVKQGRLYGSGSTVLAVTTDRIRTKVPMAERWIELWGENQAYDMTVQFQAAKPGVYPIYVRCALRGVHVKSNVTLMDPKTAPAVDQQGFPVYVYQVTVR
jgi:hypothetical protein